MHEFSEFAQQIGLAGALLVVVLAWVFKTSTDMLKQFSEERKAYMSMIDGYRVALNEHTAGAKEFHNTVTEAHKFQREEHIKMIGILTDIEKNCILHSMTIKGVDNG